jgi:hypothetical protein
MKRFSISSPAGTLTSGVRRRISVSPQLQRYFWRLSSSFCRVYYRMALAAT